jgi:hypothetical protein
MEHITSRRSGWLAGFLALALAASVSAQAKPNFSGAWKVNTSKSDFGPMPAPQTASLKIGHEDPNLKVSVSQTSDRGEFSYDAAYTTDGKESTNTIRDNPIKSVVKWDGDTLTFDTKASFAGNEVTIKDKWMLSEDGKIITVERQLSSSQGEANQKLIYEKQ